MAKHKRHELQLEILHIGYILQIITGRCDPPVAIPDASVYLCGILDKISGIKIAVQGNL